MSDPTETVPDGPTADSGIPDGPTADFRQSDGPTANFGSPDGPTADSGSREWTQRFLKFGFWSAFAIAEITWLACCT